MNKFYDFAIIGAGIVGVSTGLKLIENGKTVLILEKEKSPGVHQSGRNSGVIHSGIYYKPNSLKSNLCIRGRKLLSEFLDKEKISHRVEGKIVVDSNPSKVEELYERALRLDMDGVKILSKNEVKEKEPYCKIENALYVPQAGVVDYKVVTERLANKFISMGGEIRFFQEINNIESKGGIKSFSSKEGEFNAEFLINCAGLYSDTVAALDDIETNLRIIPFRGEYFTINPSKSNYVNNMIYPIADPDLPFLGIHLTKTISGNIEAGPNAVVAFAKEGYDWKDFSFTELSRTLFYGGTWKLGKKYLKTGVAEM